MSKYFLILVAISTFFYSCKKDNTDPIGGPGFDFVNVEVILPSGSNVDLSTSTIVSMGENSSVDINNIASLPHNNGGIELAFLLDSEDNLVLSGFITDTRRTISVESTTEVMLYYALDYYLLTSAARQAYLDKIKQISGFSDLVAGISDLFTQNPMMYNEAAYLDLINNKLDEIARFSNENERIFINDTKIKSGVTISSIDATHVVLQNSFPRRTRVVGYKKSFYDNMGNLTEIPEYWNKPILDFKFEPGKEFKVDGLDIGNSVAGAHASMASVDLASSSDPIDLPVNPPTEFSVDYQLVVIGSGTKNTIDRNLSSYEIQIQEELNIEAYALDNFLPTIMDIGGNKDLLPPFGSKKEMALLNAVKPVLESNTEVLAAIKKNDFKTASEILLPELYQDIRLSNELRELLKDVYNIISDGGSLPNTFIQKNELIETGDDRFKIIMKAMYKNMNLQNKSSVEMLRTDAKSVESWIVSSIDADITMVPKNTDLCLGVATEIRASFLTFFEPEIEEFEYHWKTSNKFGGRVQDINNDPNNFGSAIITKSNVVSYISAALDSDLGSGDNIETVTCVIYTKNKITGELTEVGTDAMQVNNKKGCVSFFAPFTKEVLINETGSQLACGGNPEYSIGHPTYVALFEAVDDAKSYKGKILRKDGTYGDEFAITSQLTDLGDGNLKLRIGVGSIFVYLTCSESQAQEEQQRRLDYMDEVGHQGIEITPVF